MSNMDEEQLMGELDADLLDKRLSKVSVVEKVTGFEFSHSINIIEKLVHLSRFGNLLTLVIGNNGSGKTTLLDTFLSSTDENCQICHIQAHPLLSIDQLFEKVIESFAGEKTFTGIPLTANQYEEWASQLSSTSDNRLLIIDDAEVLSASVLHELCQLSAMQQDKETPHLHVILFGNYDLNSILDQAAQGVLDEDGIYAIDIPSLSKEESENWLSFLWSQLRNDNYPEQDAIDDLLNVAEGNILALSDFVREFKSDSSEELIFDSEPDPKKISGIGYWFAGLSAVVLMVFGLFYFQDDIITLTSDSSINESTKPVSSQEVLGVSKKVIDQSPVNDMNEKENDNHLETVSVDRQLQEKEVLEAVNESDDLSKVSDPIDPMNKETEKDAVEDKSLLTESEAAAPIITPEESAIASTVKTTSLQEARTESKTSESTNNDNDSNYILSKDEQLLMSEPDSGYAVQLIGLSNKATVETFITDLNSSEAHYYRSVLNSNPWYIIVLSTYDNRNDAVTARDRLPTSLKKNGPWIKQIKVIKKEILAAQAFIK